MEPPSRRGAEEGGSEDRQREDGENPFSSRFVRPGAFTYIFPTGDDAESTLNRLALNHWRGEIVGPHGSGKSTLLATLLPSVEARGFTIRRIDLHDGQRALPPGWLADALKVEKPFLVLDGYEQLSRWERWRIVRAVNSHNAGLLVTAHDSVGLSRLYTSEVDHERAAQVLRRLVPKQDCLVAEADLASAMDRHPGDLRSALFALYDLYEERRRLSVNAVSRD